MTSANAINCVVSRLRSVPRKALNLNFSHKNCGRLTPKSLMWASLQGTSHETTITTSLNGGGHYDCTTIQSFQPSKLQLRCEDSNSQDGKSL
jgi:hypothetical protein